MIARFTEATRDRLVASDPGFVRLRLALSAIFGIVLAVLVLLPFGQPITVVMVGAIGAMLSAFTVHEDTTRQELVTLLLVLLTGAASLTLASLGASLPPLDGVIFVLLIFVAVYAQRWGSRGIALGSASFFLFFFAMFLQTHLAQVPALLGALAAGIAANTFVRLVLLPRRPAKELLRVRRAFRARLVAVIRAAQAYLEAGGRNDKPLRTAANRMHECVLMVEDVAPDVVDERAVGVLRRRAIEVELAVEWLVITLRRTAAEDLDPGTRADLVTALRQFGALIGRDPRELPVISDSAEFSQMLVAGSRIGEHARPGDELRHAIAELAIADVNAQRVAENDELPPEDVPEVEEEPERKAVFTYDNQTRGAIQAVVGGGLAVLGGELVSPQRWYWAVLTVFVVFLGSATAGATFVKGMRRLVGTLVGIFGGVLAALLVVGNPPATLALLLVCVFGMVYFSRVSQTIMAFFITAMLGLLYSLLGTFTVEVLWIRLAETAVGAAAGMLAAVVIVPVRTRSVMLDDVATTLEDLRAFVERAGELLSGRENVNIIELSRTLDRDVDQVRRTIEPLTHPVNVSTARRDLGWHVQGTLESIAFRARHVAARAQPGMFAGDERLPEVLAAITRKVDTLLEVVRDPSGADRRQLDHETGLPPGECAGDATRRSLLSSLDQLDAELVALGNAFGVRRDKTHPDAGYGEG
ncbi:FUSC family protein [Amycolatopsis sp. 195334CR]|uniref:FUSC family protein n=1 Tax=Amycolatopsis sp. 195334CR TaxID=2814588 RepID=UPI001A8E87B7|nr:FUSC family protein [Amycolatopsis sp. 195334CR]MBN6040163.1 FUSC family protein [Amycolatopsis sp. 195334CR]